ncbi:MAG: hypothetical protein D6753_12010 [Planctomycetota bacterium]|nr:MAG: hypothetical protein D6753_12010 [Planctomycetota bacterium]
MGGMGPQDCWQFWLDAENSGASDCRNAYDLVRSAFSTSHEHAAIRQGFGGIEGRLGWIGTVH